MSFRQFLSRCRQLTKNKKTDLSLLQLIIASLPYQLRGKNIISYPAAHIHGWQNITINGLLSVGTGQIGIFSPHDLTHIRVDGQLHIHGNVYLGKGCRIHIAKGAIAHLNHCSLTGHTRILISRSLTIGARSLISWNCELLDDHWHPYSYDGKEEKETGLAIGEHVWLGSNVQVLPGVTLANHCVVGAGSVVTKSFTEERSLIAGNPARVVRKGVSWGIELLGKNKHE